MLPSMGYRGELVFTHDPTVGAECNLLLILTRPDLHSVQTVQKVQLLDDVFLLTSEIGVWRDYCYQRILLFVLSEKAVYPGDVVGYVRPLVKRQPTISGNPVSGFTVGQEAFLLQVRNPVFPYGSWKTFGLVGGAGSLPQFKDG